MLNHLPREATRSLAPRAEVNLPTLWNELASAVAEPAQEKGLTIDLRVQDVALQGDAEALARVFRNLLSAAIHLSARDTCVAVGAHADGDDVVVQLRTEGSGGGSQVRLHRVSTRVPSEAGFALHAARELVRTHGGSVHAEFMEDFGVDFVLRLAHAAPSFV